MRVGVDLTPLLPGGENGGAKIFILGLLREMMVLTPGWQWLFLTSSATHEELSNFDRLGARRLCVFSPPEGGGPARAFDALCGLLSRSTGSHKPDGSGGFLGRCGGAESAHGGLDRLELDLLFCPFTRPFFHIPGVPAVAVVYDLQYLEYPQFFSVQERLERDAGFREAARLCDRLVCISDYVRTSVLANSGLPENKVNSIHLRLANRLPSPTGREKTNIRDQLGVAAYPYVLYPANAWPHKNHRMLFTAWSIYRHKHPQSALRLICTGQPDQRMQQLENEARLMRIASHVVFAGYLSDSDFAALLADAQALVFPSLYEGFGMPVLEAMSAGKPVLCSSVTSLPEIAGDAALYFDPRKPDEIVTALEQLLSDPSLIAAMVEKGRKRVEQFSSVGLMAEEYLQVFAGLLERQAVGEPEVYGIYGDLWTEGQIEVVYGAGDGPRHLEISLFLPPWVPHEYAFVVKTCADGRQQSLYALQKGTSLVLRHKLTSEGGRFRLRLTPVFEPKALAQGEDRRSLGCLCEGCWLVERKRRRNLLPLS